MSGDPGRLHHDEAAFHDAWAGDTDVASVPVRATFEAFLAMENRFILRLLGDLRGRRVLDAGAGLGEGAVYFALQGAEATACDLSQGMVDFARRLAAHHGVTVDTAVCPAESLDLPDGAFDVVYSGNLMHHVSDKDRVLAEFRRVLKPGGRVVTWDPIAYNPVINVYRRMATKVRTADERPLRFGCLSLYRKHFGQVRHREFWLASLAVFLKYFLLDRVHPNESRYWKRILFEPEGWSTAWLRGLGAMDRVLLRLWPLNYLAWNTVIWGVK